MPSFMPQSISPSRRGWALLLLAIVALAAGLRLWQLGSVPPGLYRDEAFNGLDALGVLNGQHAVFFTANNGREPAYIYLTAVATALFGRTIFAVRLAAALVGTLTTWLTYKLAAAWFDRLIGLWAALIWAITLWPIHLSRIGLRPILLPAALALTFWLLTLAYRQPKRTRWLLAGLAYGFCFYTYLAARFTPLLLLLVFIYWTWRDGRRRLWPGVLWFGLATAVTLLPLGLFISQHPDTFLGRTGQVSIFNPVINHGNVLQALWQHTGQALGLFIWRGDAILRHNPAGRPVFDILLALPFLLGVLWCMRHWRHTGAMITLLWTTLMLGTTILAEDTPHFLRAVGILPAAMILPAVGLAQLWRWTRLPRRLRQTAVLLFLAGSLTITLRDYTAYAQNPAVALLFEAAATQLAADVKAETETTAIYLDRWFWDGHEKGWPSLPFLADLSRVTFYRPEFGLPLAEPGQPVSLYAWRFGDLEFVPNLMQTPTVVTVTEGPPARGDLEAKSYPLYIRYHSEPDNGRWPESINLGDTFFLRRSQVTWAAAQQALQVDLYWEAPEPPAFEPVAFVHVVGPDGLVVQDDAPPANGNWLRSWWQAGQIVHETRRLTLPVPIDPTTHTIEVGLYDAASGSRLPVLDANGHTNGDSVVLPWPAN